MIHDNYYLQDIAINLEALGMFSALVNHKSYYKNNFCRIQEKPDIRMCNNSERNFWFTKKEREFYGYN